MHSFGLGWHLALYCLPPSCWMRSCPNEKTFGAFFAWNCAQPNLLIAQVMNGTGTRRQFIPQAARPGSRAAFVRGATTPAPQA